MQTTRLPVRRYGKSNSRDSGSISSLPRRLNFAIRLPCAASKPAWTMALLALLGAAADVLPRAQEHEEPPLTAAEIPATGAARHARADNDHIIHKITSK